MQHDRLAESGSDEDSSQSGSDSDLEEPVEGVEHIPLGQRLIEQDRLGGIKHALKKGNSLPKKKSKKSKHAPTEVSSRRRQKFDINASGLSVEIGRHRYQARDPREQIGTTKRTPGDEHDEFFQDLRAKEMRNLRIRMKSQKVKGKKGQRLRKKLGPGDAEEEASFLQQLLTAKAADTHRGKQRDAISAIRAERGRNYKPKRKEIREKLQSEQSSNKKRKQKNKSKDSSLVPV